MGGRFLLKTSAVMTLLGLAAMVTCLIRFSPRTLALFLGPGLLFACVGILLFFVHVFADLRSRRAL